MKRARIDLRVRTDQKEQWMAQAEQYGLELSEMIRRAVEDYLERRKPVTLAGKGRS